jgi:hypothetical protein
MAGLFLFDKVEALYRAKYRAKREHRRSEDKKHTTRFRS